MHYNIFYIWKRDTCEDADVSKVSKLKYFKIIFIILSEKNKKKQGERNNTI